MTEERADPPGREGGLLEGLRVAVVANFNPPQSGVFYQAEVLMAGFAREGARTIAVTYRQNRYLRPLATVWELFRKRRDYDVLCCQGFSYGNWINAALGSLTGKLLGKPVTMVYRGGGFREFVARMPWALLPVLRRVDRLVVPSGFLEEEFRKHGLAPRIIPNIIELEGWPYRLREKLEPKLLWVRHLRTGYNPWMAVEVLQRVQERYPGATLRMAGDGHMEDEMRERLAREGIEGVELLGHLPLEELSRHYAECDLFINTTNYDNQPRSVLEAMAAGLPVVSTDVGGLPYLIEDGVDGILVPPVKTAVMTEAVLRLLGDPELARRLGEGARRSVKSFSWSSSRWKWAEVFAELGLVSPPGSVPEGG